MDWNVTELELGRHFESAGDIEMVKILEDKKGRSLGYGYVEFEKKEFVEKALTLQGSKLNERELRVAVIDRERKAITSRKTSAVTGEKKPAEKVEKVEKVEKKSSRKSSTNEKKSSRKNSTNEKKTEK